MCRSQKLQGALLPSGDPGLLPAVKDRWEKGICVCVRAHTCAPVCVRVTEQPCVCYVCVSSAERVGGSMRRGRLAGRLMLVYFD